MDKATLKLRTRDFWNRSSCGEVYGSGSTAEERYASHRETRYSLEPFIFDFARFPEARGKDVLEIGVGMGADHLEWARVQPASLVGIDLTERAVAHTRNRLKLEGFEPRVDVGDAERLPHEDETFDVVYSWGVLHHSPNTPAAIDEVYRVLRPGGVARIMMYHRHSLTGWMLWARYALAAGRPWRSLGDVYANHLESPGTKAYSQKDVKGLFRRFSSLQTSVELSVGDLLMGAAGRERHGGMLLSAFKAVWPRRLIRRFLKSRGLFLLIEARK